MSFVGNVIWFVLFGWAIGLLWLVGAAVFAISIIGLPLTRAALEMAKLSAWPFGKDIVHVRELEGRDENVALGALGFIVNVIWAVTFGLALFVSYLFAGICCCITLIGIPFGLQAFKLAAISLWPVGRRVVTREVADMVRQDRASQQFAGYRKRA